MKALRACPICPRCGSKKFERLNGRVRLRCLVCHNIISI